MSGEAFKTTQRTPSVVTARDDWVEAGILPSRARLQFSQPQFHCGKPPPAAAPSIRALNTCYLAATSRDISEQDAVAFLGGAVHVDFHSTVQFTQNRLAPCHRLSSS
ncbi:hypothetical protein RV420_280178 [Roseovarius sp. EC-SD190]|nr:hypothetical protein RV420_280178 [Roseovarius sp. EC-SD190]